MRRSHSLWILWIAFISCVITLAPDSTAKPSDGPWKKVQDALEQGLPKTALEALEPILSRALKDGNHVEATRALGMKIELQAAIQGDKPEEKILRLQDEIAKVSATMKPPLEAMLAHNYWQYYRVNRWRFMGRTQTVGPPGPDMQTWDLRRILAAIDSHFKAALANDAELKAIPISDWDAILEKGNMPDATRPTWFDFLAHEALSFYTAGEQGVAAVEKAFEIDAGGPIFSSTAEFLNWQPETTEDGSPELEAIRLYQKLLTFHEPDTDKTAFFEVDLERLIFGRNVASGELKNERFKAAMQRFVKSAGDYPVSARALADWARMLYKEGNAAEAHRLVQKGLAAFPKSVGGDQCFNLLHQIEAKSAYIQTELVWSEPLPNISVTYRNVSHVFFRAVAYDFEIFIKNHEWSEYYLDSGERQRLLRRKPELEWHANLTPTGDYSPRREELSAPKTLKPGFYLIVASHDSSFSPDNNETSFAPVWVSDLALVMRTSSSGSPSEGFVLRAGSGEPIKGARIQTWTWGTKSRLVGETSTDGNGSFQIENNDGLALIIEHGRHRLGHFFNSRSYRRPDIDPKNRTTFFTDRSLYRPGQTIYYKGIHFRSDPTLHSYHVLAGARVKVTFQDANGKEIAIQEHQCNDYGSFNGVFTAPRDRLMGRMRIVAKSGETSFRVEEYKRPKFEVELLAPIEAAKLNANVVVPGRATSYTGAAIGGVQVRWRVMRSVRFPTWWWRGGGYGRGQHTSQAIAHGRSTTQVDGSFTVEFRALPDRQVTKTAEPIFEYRIYADITDATGETRSAERSVRVGYTALKANMSANSWQTNDSPVELRIKTASLDGHPLAADGTVKVYHLEQPDHVVRASLSQRGYWGLSYWEAPFRASLPEPDPSDPKSWKLGMLASEKAFQTDETGNVKLDILLEEGIYRAVLKTTDPFGKSVQAQVQLQVVKPKAKHFSTRIAQYLGAPKWNLEPGERFTALWGTGYRQGRAFVEIEKDGRLLHRYWTHRRRTQTLIEQAITEDLRGGFTLRVMFVRENRAYFEERIVVVPWSNKELTLKWESFRTKLEPGKKETWSVSIAGPDSSKAVAEMVAGLYDASLNQILPHNWMQRFNVFPREARRIRTAFVNRPARFYQIVSSWRPEWSPVIIRYRTFSPEVLGSCMLRLPVESVSQARALNTGVVVQGGQLHVRGGRSKEVSVRMSGAAQALRPGEMNLPPGTPESAAITGGMDASYGSAGPAAPPDLGAVQARRNLQETAFFFPHLLPDENGRVQMKFTVPEALTRWKFLGFAHDAELRSGFLSGYAVTAKDLMVQPNPPRFVREGDVIEFTVKVSNRTDETQTGRVRLTLADARTLQSMDEALGNNETEINFTVPGQQSKTYAWKLQVPDGCDFLTYKAVGATANISDGEEGFLPVLSRRILVTESLPLPIRGKQEKHFEFSKLLASGKSTSLQHQSLTLQMVSQPVWYAVMALPYLMEFPYQCSEQTFNRLYANSLAQHIAESDANVRRVFDQWKATPALESPLQKNEDLKAVMLEETPWILQAQNEAQSRRNVAILFDANRLQSETRRGLRQLSEMQLADGMFPWFPGGSSNEYITLYITSGFGRLRHLGVNLNESVALKSLRALDAWMDGTYRAILLKCTEKQNHLSPIVALYLYGRSFFQKDHPVATTHREAIDYWLQQARDYWLHTNSRQTKAHLALGLRRFGDRKTPLAIMKSIAEHSVQDEELGMYWRDLEFSWWWYRAPIETQALMIEAFDEVMNDTLAVENCKVWLLKQKQTRDWKTTKATADAIYGLLLSGQDLLASHELVQVSLGDKMIEPENVEAGTGFYEHRFYRDEVQPEMGRVRLTKTDDGVSWGSLHWQYLEDMNKVTPHVNTPLKLKKTLFTKAATGKGQTLMPLTGVLHVGDELVTRIELRTDRDMEYVHLKDQRGSGVEPTHVLSGYRYQDGLAYYESTRDTASHFFIDYLPKGVYVFEYSTRIQHNGQYQSGVASIQCMYAPEFNSHSQSFVLNVE